MRPFNSFVAVAALAFASAAPAAPAHPAESGTIPDPAAVTLPAAVVPFSRHASPVARYAFIAKLAALHVDQPKNLIEQRAHFDVVNHALVAAMRALYPVTIVRSIIDGVPVETIAPAAGITAANRGKVLIDVHGGAFTLGGGGAAGEVESIPIAALSGIAVVAVDYRLAPEHRFPAASEDVTAVYRWLLKSHRAIGIGIYGCSSGAIVTGETVAWLQARHLPTPGAIGTFCASIADLGGDSDFTAPALLGLAPPSSIPPITAASNGYLDGQSPDDPLVRPSASRAVMAAFPPTLLITGTRDFAMSNVIQSQRLLTEAGVDAELHVWDGMWHAFFYDPALPESREAYRVIAAFFDRHLK